MTFGEKLRQARNERKLTLKAFCEQHHLVQSQHSTVERDLAPPPDNKKYLAVYMDLFGLQPGTPEWSHFLDELAIARQRIPKDVSRDQRLPLVFEGLRQSENIESFIAFMQRI